MRTYIALQVVTIIVAAFANVYVHKLESRFEYQNDVLCQMMEQSRTEVVRDPDNTPEQRERKLGLVGQYLVKLDCPRT